MKTILVAALLIVGTIAIQNIPIPSRPDGVSFGPANATFQLEVFYDLLCPHCRDSFATIKPILRNLLNNTNFRFTIHIFPLPYHHQSYLTGKAEKFIEQNFNSNYTFYFIETLFNNQDQFYNDAIANLTLPQIQWKLANLTSTSFKNKVSAQALYNAVNNASYDSAARLSWKYACERGVAGTPVYFANNIRVDDAASFTASDWVNFFSQYVPGFSYKRGVTE